MITEPIHSVVRLAICKVDVLEQYGDPQLVDGPVRGIERRELRGLGSQSRSLAKIGAAGAVRCPSRPKLGLYLRSDDNTAGDLTSALPEFSA
jgi:hypothetical protein